MADQPAQNPQAQNEKQLLLQKIYVKDLSFESPKAPEIFTSNAVANTKLDIASSNRALDQENVEVTLTLTVQSKREEETLFLIEIVQAGIFTIRGYSDQERHVLLGTFCPGTLYPFAREAVADTAQKGGFPQLLLQPINFDALYAQALQKRVQEEGADPAAQPAAVEAPGSGETH